MQPRTTPLPPGRYEGALIPGRGMCMRYYPFERNTHVGERQFDVWNGRSRLGSFEFVGRRSLRGEEFPHA